MPDEILLKIQADIKDLKNKVKQIESEFSGSSKKIGKHTDDMNKRFANMGKLIQAAFAAAIIRKFVQGINNAVKAASDLEEQATKFRTVFRGSLDVANNAVKDLTRNFGMSEREARQFMAGVQDMLVPIGMARDEAANFSDDIVRLAADLGSFNNIPIAFAMDKIKSALVGMYRPMRDVGVVLTATSVAQRALKDGLAKTEEELTAMDKALTAYKMMVEGSADAMGDMARTHDSYANASKRAAAAMEDFKANVGKNVMPALGFWKEELVKILKLTSDIMNLYNKETPKAASMQDWMRQRIVELRVEEEKYQKIIESGRGSTERARAEKKLVELKEEETRLQERLNKFIKEGKDVNYFEDQKKDVEGLNDELKAILAKLKEMESQREKIGPIFDVDETYISPENKKFLKWLNEAYPLTPYTEEGLEKQREHAQLMKDLGKDIDDINKSFEEGIKYVWDWGNAIDAVFSRAQNKGEQFRQLFWSLVGGSIGFAIGGPGGVGIGAQIGGRVGGLFESSSQTSTNRRSAELSNQAVNVRSYTAYRIGAN